MLRRRFPRTPIQITTNGIGLCHNLVALLAQANPRLIVNRGGKKLMLTLAKPAHASWGVVMDWDHNSRDVVRARRMARSGKGIASDLKMGPAPVAIGAASAAS